MELLRDNKFRNGFTIGHWDALISRDAIGEWRFSESELAWRICQWCTKHNLLDGVKKQIKNSDIFENIAKRVEVNHNFDSVSLEISAQYEYDRPRIENQGWPHLLLEQTFQNQRVSCFKEFTVEFDISFDYFNDFMKDARSALHTCQFQWFFAIGKKNPEQEVVDFFWFGIGMADYPRYQFVPPYQAIDGGKEEHTNKFIYIIDSKKYLPSPFVPNERAKVTYNAMSDLKEAFLVAKKRGYLKDAEFSDLEVLSTNIGIEMTGTFASGFTIHKLNVQL